MGSSVGALKSSLTAGKGLLSSVQAMLPDSRELLKSGQDTGAEASRLIRTSEDLSDTMTDSVGNVLDIEDGLMDSVDRSVRDAIDRWDRDANAAAGELDKASDVLNTLLNVNQKLFDLVNHLKEKIPGPGKVLGVLSDMITSQIDRQKNMIHMIETAEDTVLRTGKLPEDARQEIRKSLDEMMDQGARITDQYHSQVKPALTAGLDSLYDSISAASDYAVGINGLLPQIDGTLTQTTGSFDSLIETLDQTCLLYTSGKTECWYILDCDPGTEIVIGHHAGSHEEMEAMIRGHQWDEFIRKVPVKKGDFFQINPGCVHAIKGGTLILETQQSSDITYRVYDYDRPVSYTHLDVYKRQGLSG